MVLHNTRETVFIILLPGTHALLVQLTVCPLDEDADTDESVERDPEDVTLIVFHVAAEGVPLLRETSTGVLSFLN